MDRHAHIRTARLTLRPLEPTDAEAVAAGVGNYDVARWLSVVPYPYGLDDAHAFVARHHRDAGRVWAIVDTHGLCGVISTLNAFAFWLARRAWGQGYLTEAGDAVADAWFADPRAEGLMASHMIDNTRSAHVLEKLGFEDAGAAAVPSRMRGQEVPGRMLRLTRERWKARRRYRLRTGRLRLRELRFRDLPALRRIGGDPLVARNMASTTSPWPEAAARAWLARALYRGRPGFCAGIRLRTGRLIGIAGLGRAGADAPMGAAWFVDPAYWGRGYATEGVGAFLHDAMARFGIDTLEAGHFADNPAGGAVMRKLGFVEMSRDTGTSGGRLEPAPVIVYRLDRPDLKAAS